MNTSTRSIVGAVLLALAVMLVPSTIRAEVTRIEITSREDVLGGKAFGTVGAYEKLYGKVYFAVDPNNAHNKNIADVDKAPRKDGKVEFSSDLFVVRPKDPSKSNGVAFFDVLNRGGKGILTRFNRASGSADPKTEAEYGDGFLMREGYTIVAVGWQFDVRKDRNPMLIGLDAPIATENGRPITGWVNQENTVNMSADSIEYSRDTWAYKPLDPKDPGYRLTESAAAFVIAPRLIPREDWQFGRMQNGQLSADTNWITLKGGFKAGYTYEVTYETQNPPVAGLGFAAIRDLASAMKYKPDTAIRAQYVYTTGESQTGRAQRQLIYDGFTIDEQGRKAIDALVIRVGGGSLGSFNERFAVPNELGAFYHTKFPLRYDITTDPATGKRDGLGARIPAGLEPKIIQIDSGSEIYGQGRVGNLLHTTLDGLRDLPDPPNFRYYVMAGSKHIAGTWPPKASETQQLLENPNDFLWLHRGLLTALDAWVKKGVEPPVSQYPKLSDGTLVDQTVVKYPNVPGVQWPQNAPGSWRTDVAGPLSYLPLLVSRVDADGNEIGGVRLPEQAVPLGTYTPWALRSERAGLPHTMVAYAGGYIPFARTKAEREQEKDPRMSVEERYSSRADYVRRVEEVANKLAQQRYLLQSDVKTIAEDAGKHWDWTMTTNRAGN